MSKFVTILTSIMLAACILPAASVELGEKVEEAGTRMDLPDGSKLQLTIKDKQIIGEFIDAEGLLIEPVAESIVVVVDDPGHKNDEWRTVIRPTGENTLSSPRRLYPPYKMIARLIVRFPDGTTKTFPYASLELDRNLQ